MFWVEENTVKLLIAEIKILKNLMKFQKRKSEFHSVFFPAWFPMVTLIVFHNLLEKGTADQIWSLHVKYIL